MQLRRETGPKSSISDCIDAFGCSLSSSNEYNYRHVNLSVVIALLSSADECAHYYAFVWIRDCNLGLEIRGSSLSFEYEMRTIQK